MCMQNDRWNRSMVYGYMHPPEILNSPTYIEISVLSISIIKIFSDQVISGWRD